MFVADLSSGLTLGLKHLFTPDDVKIQVLADTEVAVEAERVLNELAPTPAAARG